MNKLLDAYSGDKAEGYDARRATSTRWKNEIAAMNAMLPKTGATRVLDCPFGTGRWVPQYMNHGLSVIGVDLSAGMLAEAQAKVDQLPEHQRAAFTLREGSIFDLDPADDPQAPDLIACIRFLNWIDFSDVEQVIALLTRYNTNHMIIGASVIPQKTNRLRRWWYRTSLSLINRRHLDRPPQFVHEESALRALLARHGWQIAEQTEIMRRNARVNYFYRLTRA